MLTDAKCRKAETRDKGYKLGDEKGLYLFVTPNGARSWRMKYRFADKEKVITFGLYPELSLAQARDLRDEARAHIRNHRDPAAEREKARHAAHTSAGHTFESLARRWHETVKSRWKDKHADNVLREMVRDLFPEIGDTPIRDLDAPTVLRALRRIEARGAVETAKRARSRVDEISAFAISEGLASLNPAQMVTKALRPNKPKGRRPAFAHLSDARDALRRIETDNAQPGTKLASRLIALTALRPGVVSEVPWTEIDAIDRDEMLWKIPARRMKLKGHNQRNDPRYDFWVPVTPQMMEVFDAARSLSSGLPFVFPNVRNARRPMSENAVGYLYNRNGLQGLHCPHGWRSTFSTVMNEIAMARGTWEGDNPVIDMMLAHIKGDVESIYNRAAYLDRRRAIAQEWADMLIDGLAPAELLLEGPRK